VAVFGTGIRYMLMLVAQAPSRRGSSHPSRTHKAGGRRVLCPPSPAASIR
jgi:hypothetical protein